VAAGGPQLEGLTQSIAFMRATQSNEGISLIDKEDEFEAFSYTFAGLDNILLQFSQQISGAVGMPITKLFSQSPAGLNATGDSDMRNYYDEIGAIQNSKLRTPIGKIIEISHRSLFGTPPAEGTTFTFRALWDLSDTEKANIAKTVTDSVVAAKNAGIISTAAAAKELRQSSKITGVYSNILDADIKEQFSYV
jgi:uncharacterized protein